MMNSCRQLGAKLLLAGLLAVILQGCASVTVDQPIGQKAGNIKAEEWEGVWFSKDFSLTFQVLDPEQGSIRIARIGTDDDTLKLESYPVELRRAGEWMFASLKASPETDRWLWARVEKDDYQLIFWLPDPEKFKRLVRDGLLPGRIDGDDVILGDLKPVDFERLMGKDSGALFLWDEPFVFRPLGRY